MIDSVFLEASAEIEAVRRAHSGEPYAWDLQRLPQRLVEQKRCQAVWARNRTSFRIAFWLTAIVAVCLVLYVQALAQYSGAAQLVGYTFAGLLGAAMLWVLVSAFVAVRLSAWAVSFGAEDDKLSPAAALEQSEIRALALSLEYRPPFAFSRPMVFRRH